MAQSAEGFDVSAFQRTVTRGELSGVDFAWCKATGGASLTDPHFTANWPVMGDAGAHRGAYHELWAGGGKAQAAHFARTVKAAGLRPGDMLAVVASDYKGVTDAEVLTFCQALRGLAGPHHPILVYTDLTAAKTLFRTSARFGLWVTWPSPHAPTPAQWAPAKWETWRFWQWGITRRDRDAFNGTRAALDAWITTYLPRKPAPPAAGGKPPKEDPVFVNLPPGAHVLLTPWERAKDAGLPEGASHATLVVAGGKGALMDITVRWFDGHTDGPRHYHPGWKAVLVYPGSLAGVETVEIHRKDDQAAVPASATLSAW